MKFRSSLLVACIVVVPLIAMFSHRIPPGARAAVGDILKGFVGGGRPGPSRPAVSAATPEPALVSAPVPAAPIAPAGSPPAAAVPPVVVPVTAVASAPASLDRLRELGAVAIDCRPLVGHGGHVASCRVPIDGAGQLERVFQAVGADPGAAADNLLRDVTVWRRGATEQRPGTLRF